MSQAILPRSRLRLAEPRLHPDWELMRVVSGHTGWVHALAVDVSNRWFASASADRTIKIWDLASSTLLLTLTGHIGAVTGLAVSDRHPYLFSCGDDKMIKCWDLEQNKVVRQYHGHLSGVYSISLHPSLDVLVTGGRDGVARVWDMSTKQPIHTLAGHRSSITVVRTSDCNPQVLTGSQDTTMRLWDLAAGRTIVELTHHKKSIRDLILHPVEFTFCSASASSIKKFGLPKGIYLHDMDMKEGQAAAPHMGIINAMAVNQDGVLVAGGDDGSICFWDWPSGKLFQRSRTIGQPGTLDAEVAIKCMDFDRTGLRLITGEVDKSIKIWKEKQNNNQDE